MRIVAKILTVIVLICALGVGYVFVASNVRYAELGRQVVAGADKVDWFDGVVSAIETDADNMSLYLHEPLGQAEDYVFVTYTVQLKNWAMLPQEWFTISLEPKAGDVAMFVNPIDDVPAFGEGQFSFTLVTRRGSVDYARDVTMTYYFYGHEKSAHFTVGAQKS